MIYSPYATRLTLYGVVDMHNYKPFTNKHGQFTSHPAPDWRPSKAQIAFRKRFIDDCQGR